jgi:hypothetical protein
MAVYRKKVSQNQPSPSAPVAGQQGKGTTVTAPAQGQKQAQGTKPALSFEDQLAEFAAYLKENKDKLAASFKGSRDPVASAEKSIADLMELLNDPAQRYTATTIITKVPREVTLGCLQKLGSMGLTPDARAGTAFLTPRRNRDGSMTLAAVPGVRGMEQQLMETGQVAVIRSQIVREQDVPFYEVDTGVNPTVKFRRNLRVDRSKPNDIVAAFGYVEAKDGRKIVIEKVFERREQGTGALIDADTGREVNATRMDEATSARYVAQRAAMREAAHTLFHDFANIRAIFDLESETLSTTEEITNEEQEDQSVKQDSPALPPNPAKVAEEQEAAAKEAEAAAKAAEAAEEQATPAEEVKQPDPIDETLERVKQKAPSVTEEAQEDESEEEQIKF